MSSPRTGIIFGTDTGNTEDIANRIAEQLKEHGIDADLHNITDVGSETFGEYELLIMGIPTWDFGGIQADWEDFEDALKALDLNGQVVALYGLGDQFGYGDYFIDAVGWLHECLADTGAKFVGYWSTEGYEFDGSRASIDDGKRFCGLAVDEDQQFELSDDRVERWLKQVVAEYAEKKEAA